MFLKGMNINVEKSGNGKNNIILLHGWGQSTKTFMHINNYLKSSFTVYNIDLPGFGLSDKPTHPFNTLDYANVLKGIIDYYSINEPIIIGHSFGGRIAIKYTASYDSVKKLVLIDSAGIVHKKKINYYIKVYLYKLLKKCMSLPILKQYKEKMLSKFGSSDYKNACEIMKKTLVKIVNEDLRLDLLKITCPTLLIWGTNDDVTPLNDAYIMRQHLHDAGIVEIEKGGHFSYLDNPYMFKLVLDVFLNDDR